MDDTATSDSASLLPPTIQRATIPAQAFDMLRMSGISKAANSLWGDLEDGKYKPRKSEHKRREFITFLSRTKRSTWQLLGVVALFILVCLYYRNEYEAQISALNEQIIMHELELGHSRPKPRYSIVTIETRDVTYWKQSLGNKFYYARKHGYDFIPHFQPMKNDDRGFVWAKIPIILDAMQDEDIEWVFWMDFDSLFTNLSTRIEDFLLDAEMNYVNMFNTGQQWSDVDMIATKDCRKFNAGMMFFRNSAWTRELLDTVWSYRFTKDVNEQMIIEDYLEARGEFGDGSKHFIQIDQHKMNAYPEEITCHQNDNRPWKHGDWLIHFPGAWAYWRDREDAWGDMLRLYYPRIVE